MKKAYNDSAWNDEKLFVILQERYVVKKKLNMNKHVLYNVNSKLTEKSLLFTKINKI